MINFTCGGKVDWCEPEPLNNEQWTPFGYCVQFCYHCAFTAPHKHKVKVSFDYSGFGKRWTFWEWKFHTVLENFVPYLLFRHRFSRVVQLQRFNFINSEMFASSIHRSRSRSILHFVKTVSVIHAIFPKKHFSHDKWLTNHFIFMTHTKTAAVVDAFDRT